MKTFLFHTQAMAVVAVLLLAACLGLYFFAIDDEQAIYNNASDRLDMEKITVRRMELDLGSIRQIVTRTEDNQEQIDYFRTTFLKQKDERLLQISAFLDQTAKAHRLKLDQVTYSIAQAKEQDLEMHQISLPLSGRYRDIRAFVADVETSDLFLVVTEMSLEDTDRNSGKVDVQLRLATYFEKEAS